MGRTASSSYEPTTFWDEQCRRSGTTGIGDRILYRYNQPLRLKMVNMALSRLDIHLPGLRVLDVGCGTGTFVEEFARKGALVTGTDISKEALAKAGERVKGRENVTLLQQRVEKTDFPPRSFDLVSSIAVLQHVVQPELFGVALDRIVSVIKPRGYLLLMERAPRAFRKQPPSGYLTNRTREDWVRALRERGCSLACERRLPELGMPLIESFWRRGFFLLLYLLRFSPATREEVRSSIYGSQGNRVASFLYRLYAVGEHFLLALARPVDHWLLMPLPSKWSVVRVMVFVKEEDGQKQGV